MVREGYVEKVIYKNEDNGYAVFTVEGENCGESIFELQCEATDAMKEDGSIGSQFCQVQGVRGAGQWDLGWGWHMATEYMAQAYEQGDPRKNSTLLYFRHSDSVPYEQSQLDHRCAGRQRARRND